MKKGGAMYFSVGHNNRHQCAALLISSCLLLGFSSSVRSQNVQHGKITTFDVPGAIYGTLAQVINDEGTIVGYYYDAAFNIRAFIRYQSGTIRAINVPGSVWGAAAQAINGKGEITGYFVDATNQHGFVRARDGTFTTFDVTSSGQVYVVGMSGKGVIMGFYYPP